MCFVNRDFQGLVDGLDLKVKGKIKLSWDFDLSNRVDISVFY